MTGQRDGDFAAFAHVTADKATTYRAVMGAFTAAKERFAVHLRPADVARGLPGDARLPEDEVETCLLQLCVWGNLRKDSDTAEVTTVEEFYRTRYLYQLTVEGEAAERALRTYHDALAESGELQAAALGDIRELLGELADLAEAGDVDDGQVHRILTTLRTRFDELTAKAQTFIAGLQRTIDLHGVDVATFVAYKDTLIEYLERFIGDLVVATADIVGRIERIEAAGVDAVLAAAARRELADALAPTAAEAEAAAQRWGARWSGLRAWFIAGDGQPSQAEVLRARARSAIPALLRAVAAINDRRVTRTDRFTDLRTLARWFAQADSDADAHRLWRSAFALTPARHLQVNADTLDARDDTPVAPQTSWLHAPPLRLSPRLRRSGRHAKRGRPSDVVDRSAGKALLAAAIEAEAAQVEAARRLLATGRPTRLSEIGELDPLAFELFLDLLGEALAAKVTPGDVVETTSADGTLAITLEPAQGTATITTSAGCLSGPDHLVTIRDAFSPPDRRAPDRRAPDQSAPERVGARAS